VFIWGLHLSIAGVALGTSLGAWVNVGALVFFARRRELLRLSSEFRRALAPILLAAGATGAGALTAVALGNRFVHGAGGLHNAELLGFAIVVASLAYGAVVFAFRRALPVGRGA